jgi:hypothetical protein
MTTYWSILEKIHGSKLRLTKIDDEIHDHFKQEFPDFDLKARIDEDDMKSKEGKEKWRKFISAYEKKIEDYNFGAMLRASAAEEYNQDGTIFGTWWSICITRMLDTDVMIQLCACSSTRLRLRGIGEQPRPEEVLCLLECTETAPA